MTTVMNGALSQLWGLVNSMQMIVHVPLFNIVLHDDVLQITGFIIEVATFDLPGLNVVGLFGKKSYSGFE